MVSRVIEEEFSVSYHPAHVSKILHDLGFSVQRPRKILARADKKKQSHWTRYTYPNIKKSQKRRAAPYAKILWGYRDLFSPVSLSLPTGIQCSNLYGLFGEVVEKLFSSQNPFHSGQCFLPQGFSSVGLVFRTSQAHRGLQFTTLFPGTQCCRAPLASYASSRYTQSLFQNSGRIGVYRNFYISQHAKKHLTDTWVSATISVIM